MADNGVENNSATRGVEKQIEAKVAQKTTEQLREEIKQLATKVGELKSHITRSIQEQRGIPQYFEGDKDDKDTYKGKAHSIKELIQQILWVGKSAPEKIPLPENKPPAVSELSKKLIQELGNKIHSEDVTEQSAPYIYDLLQSVTEGKIATVDALANELKKMQILQHVSPSIYQRIQNSCIDIAKQQGLTQEAAESTFGIDRKEEANAEKLQRTRTPESDQSWQQLNFGSYFNNTTDRPLVQAIYSAEGFIQYYEDLKQEIITNNRSSVYGMRADSEKVGQAASMEMEQRFIRLFGKLYTRLDHEKPSEFFQAVEQEDMMRGIMPVKSELKRRIQRLSQDLHEYEHKLKEKGIKIEFFKRMEEDSDIMDVPVTTKEGRTVIKPRKMLKTLLTPKATEGAEFTHYLEQMVDHYIDTRKYTHNARAIFLHPADAQKGFYGQLAQFANDFSQLDFDQMMHLPDYEIFQDAFGLYNKILEETFAKNDWRHTTTMFTPKENSHYSELEEHVMDKLKLIYNKEHYPDMSDDRLDAAMSMAVGASRGMFLTEIEQAAFADPHLKEDGSATFASYYNQDATALVAFNAMHSVYRFHGGPLSLDPIYFLPLKGVKGSQGMTDHRELWAKTKMYKESFLKGRKAFKGEETFADMLVNIGLIGGPMQRKGWRTSFQLESLYIFDKSIGTDKDYVDHLKTFQKFENIGYELLQDYVSKLDGKFANSRDTHSAGGTEKKLAAQKKELFSYIFEKYFDKNPDDLNPYLDKIRATKTDEAMQAIREGKISPSDLKAYIEGNVTKEFLDRGLARVIMQRIPSKVLRMSRDRLSEDGKSRWKQIMEDMGLSFKDYDAVMQNVILAEQLLRKEVSTTMHKYQDNGKGDHRMGEISYRLSPDKMRALLAGRLSDKQIQDAVTLYEKMQERYMKDDVIDKEFVKFFKNGGARDRASKFTVALDETDMSFIPFRGAGQSVLKRAITDINTVEEKITKPLGEMVKRLKDMAINGKQDFGPIIEIIDSAYRAMEGIIAPDYANELASKLAAMTIMYMKKDAISRPLGGIFGLGKLNSMAAETAGRGTAVWEWDSRDIDRFIVALESRGLIPKNPYNHAKPPEYEAKYINIPFVKNPVKLPEKIEVSKWLGIKEKTFTFFGKEYVTKEVFKDIPLFTRRVQDYTVWSKQLRDGFGGTKMDMLFDILTNFLPLLIAMILFKQMKEALEGSEGKKK